MNGSASKSFDEARSLRSIRSWKGPESLEVGIFCTVEIRKDSIPIGRPRRWAEPNGFGEDFDVPRNWGFRAARD